MAKGGHKLSGAFVGGSALTGLIQNGLGALKGPDVQLIAVALRPGIAESLDLDAASVAQHPQANRWDYLLSLSTPQEIVGVEPHSARDGEISVVVAKKKHAMEYLRAHLKPGVKVSKWFWITRGVVGFSRMDRAQRQLDQNGISFKGRMLRDFD